jgi:hypothetical protein
MCFISKSFMGAKDIAFHHSKAKFENIEHVQTKVLPWSLPSIRWQFEYYLGLHVFYVFKLGLAVMKGSDHGRYGS